MTPEWNAMNSDTMIRGFDFDKVDANSLNETTQKKRPGTAPASLSKANIIDMIFMKMQQKGGFPSFSKQISDINKILKLKYASAKDIANVIIKDFSLSNKLLNLVNSSFYGQFSKDGITSVEKAMIILGADQVQQAAASLMLFEHMQASSHSKELKNIAVKTFMSGLLAKELAGDKGYKDADEFLICAMFYKLGENLVAYYFAEKGDVIRRLSSNGEISASHASRVILGITYQELGIGVAKKWGLPENIIKSMCFTGLKDERKGAPTSRTEMLGTVAAFSNRLCDIQFSDYLSDKQTEIRQTVSNYYHTLGIEPDMIGPLLLKVARKIKHHSSHLDINIDHIKMLKEL